MAESVARWSGFQIKSGRGVCGSVALDLLMLGRVEVAPAVLGVIDARL